MEIEIKEVEECKLKISYQANAEEILNKRAEVLNAFKKAPVPGFRAGKATVDAIRMHYREQIEDALKRALAEDAYHNTIFEKKLRPHGAPRFNALMLADGKFNCEFDLFTKPNFDLKSYENLEVVKPAASEDINTVTEAMLQDLRVKFGEVTPYEATDFIQTGDNVILDYEGFVNGEKIEQLCSVGEMLTVGSSNLDNFDNNLLGMSIGETREFDIVVPEAGLPSLAGKTVHLKVTLNMGSKTVPCALDDTLAEKIGKKDFNDLRAFVAGTAMAKVQNDDKRKLNEALANKLVQENDLKVPNWLTLSEARYLVHQSKMDWETLPDVDKEKYMEMAERNVKLSLILDKIREVEPASQLTDQEVFDVVKANLAKTKVDTSIDDVIKEMNKTGYLQILFSRIRDENTLDFVFKTVKIVE